MLPDLIQYIGQCRLYEVSICNMGVWERAGFQWNQLHILVKLTSCVSFLYLLWLNSSKWRAHNNFVFPKALMICSHPAVVTRIISNSIYDQPMGSLSGNWTCFLVAQLSEPWILSQTITRDIDGNWFAKFPGLTGLTHRNGIHLWNIYDNMDMFARMHMSVGWKYVHVGEIKCAKGGL